MTPLNRLFRSHPLKSVMKFLCTILNFVYVPNRVEKI